MTLPGPDMNAYRQKLRALVKGHGTISELYDKYKVVVSPEYVSAAGCLAKGRYGSNMGTTDAADARLPRGSCDQCFKNHFLFKNAGTA